MALAPPPRALTHPGMAMGFSSMESRPAVMALIGARLGRAAVTLAFQNIFFLAATVAVTAVVPAVLINRFGRTPAARNV